jgi:SNF2 family DNA or RNA helicase
MVDAGAPPPTTATAAAPERVRAWHPQGDALLDRWGAGDAAPAMHFELRIAAERWAGWAGTDRLVSLDSLRGVERFTHQIKACDKVMRDLNGRAILADEVGLGKTIEAGIVLKEYVMRGAVRTALVLVPASLCEQWRAELWEKFELDFIVSRGPSGQWGKHPLVISSLETARHERHRRRVRGANYDMVVVDEAHRLRNHLTLGWKFINDLNPRYLLLLTATPVQNDMRELYNLATLVRPGTVGTFSQFRRDFLTGHDKRTPRNTPRLRALLEAVMIRTRRSDTDLVFAPRKVETLWVGQSPAERVLYHEVSDFVADAVRGDVGGPGRPHYFTLMVLQKEMGSSWAAARATLEKLSRKPDGLDAKRLKLLATRAEEAAAEPSKVRSLLRCIGGLNGEKCIIFTQFRSTQDTIVDALRATGIEPAVFHGEMGWREKEESLDRFRTAAPVLVSTEAGGEGRNLQFCRIVINYDLPWNPMRVEQRIGRVHRLGQAHPVRVVNLVARGTIEAYVLEILDKKIRMFELVVGEMEEILGTWQPHGSFEDEVFRRWTESTDPRARKRRFTELAQHLVVARRLYQQQKDRQEWLFPTVDEKENHGNGHASE